MSTVEKPTEKTAATTAYVILRREPDGTWRADGVQQRARSAQQAVRQTIELRAEADVDAAGTYVAIPARSFQPVTAKVETQTVLKLEDA